jgi:integrase/recombinase XerD
METTFKIVLDKRRPKKNDTYPLRMRVYQNRDYKTYSLGIDLRESDWNEQIQQVKTSNPSHKLYNVKITTLKAKIQKSIFMNEDEEEIISPEGLINQITRSRNKQQIVKPDLLAYGKQHISKLQAEGRIGNSIVYSCAINKLKAYVNSDTLTFQQVNYSFIEKFNTALLAEGMKVNGISNYMRTIRALFNKARKEEIISADCYPFSKFKIRSERTINRNLTIAEIESIANLDLPADTPIWHHRNLFMLSFCLIGMNFADLLTLTKENFVDGRIVFRRKKTHKVYSILLLPKIQELFNLYRSEASGTIKRFVLPFVVYKNNPSALRKDIMQAIKNTNDYLPKIAEMCKVNKSITTYYARYSWANAQGH